MRWVLVDIETTGLNVIHDRITEIAVIVLTENGIESQWSRLINPNRSIPTFISQLTGITNEKVADAPLFSDIAEELLLILDDHIFVAHNARFDYGFLKNAFAAAGYSLRVSVLCTIKLFKKLYPGLPKYSLKALANHFNISIPTHRAEADVKTIVELIQQAKADHSEEFFFATAKECYQKSSLPSKLITEINSIPDAPGVYIFYSEDAGIPLYIGKSVHLKQRILSHFQSDYGHPKEFALAQQVVRIEVIPTAGELSALILESALIKEKMPLYNRRLRRQKNTVGYKLVMQSNYFTIEIIKKASTNDIMEDLYGAFRSATAAKENLISLVKEFQLCPKLCGLESAKNACFSFQLKRCKGACVGKESAEEYNARVLEAVGELKKISWPFKGTIAIKEHCSINQLTQYSVFNQWRHIGTVTDLAEIDNRDSSEKNYDFDVYKILVSHFKKITDQDILEI